MKVLLINPGRSFRTGNVWKSIDRSLPPLGLAYIASFLEKNNVPVEILDIMAENLSEKEIKGRVKKSSPDLIGLTSVTVTYKTALKIAKLCKQVCPDAKIIFGGVHPTIYPSEVLSHDFVDFVAVCEGELTMVELAKAMEAKDYSKVPGILYKKNGKQLSTPSRQFIADLDTVPLPAYHLLPMHLYRPALGNYKKLPAMSMLGTRGCPGRCTFCFTGVFGSRTRHRSAASLLNEIRFLIKHYGIKEVSFYDDSFTANRKVVREMCQGLIDEGIKLSWSCMSRVDLVDQETLNLMKKAGCHQIGYGVESADPQILKNINKMISLDKVKAAVRMTKKAGIDVRAMFMLGNPGETEETIEKTIQFAIDLSPDLVIFNITTPLPGTGMFEWAKKNGYLTTLDWDKYDLSVVVMKLPTVSKETILKYYSSAYKRFYLRPAYLFQRLLKIRSLTDIKVNIDSFKAMLNI